MNFNSIDEIVAYFSFESADAESVKKELMELIKKVHPDKNNGDFKNETDENMYHEIQNALKYLSNNDSNVSLVKQDEMTALAKVLKELVLTKKSEDIIVEVEKKSSALTTRLQESVLSFHNSNSSPKITGISVTAVITALWAFPSVVKDHPMLKILYNYNKEFTVIWLYSLLFMGMLWIKIKKSEKLDEEIKRSYKLESTQNHIFLFFIRWMRANHKNYDIVDGKRVVIFSKDELISFLITRFEILKQRFKGKEDMHDYDIEREIKFMEEQDAFVPRRKNYLKYFFLNFLPEPGKIDLEIAQLISDLIIERLKLKEIIRKSDHKALSDNFIYEEGF